MILGDFCDIFFINNSMLFLDLHHKANRQSWTAIGSGYLGDLEFYAPDKAIDDNIGHKNIVYISAGPLPWLKV